MEIERIDFRDAIKELARQTNFDLTPYERNPEITEKRQQDREKLKLLNKRLQEFFVSQFS
jgi:DNA primase